jgi:diguanylate cyclase (GGDEF)-like protein
MEVEERMKSQELAENHAKIDSLTGVYSRRYFFSLAKRCISESVQKRLPLSIIIASVDHYRQVNDHHGHIDGEKALVSIATKIGALLRKDDIVGRYGGEEFVILLPSIGTDLALKVADRLRRGIEALEISPEHNDLRLTLSLGVTSLQVAVGQETPSLEAHLQQAEQALDEARRLGCNRAAAYSTLG